MLHGLIQSNEKFFLKNIQKFAIRRALRERMGRRFRVARLFLSIFRDYFYVKLRTSVDELFLLIVSRREVLRYGVCVCVEQTCKVFLFHSCISYQVYNSVTNIKISEHQLKAKLLFLFAGNKFNWDCSRCYKCNE